jgi:predicted amidophosphoribosyltransferase
MSIVPVPAAKRNRRQRGFDQGLEMLRHLAPPWREACRPCLERADGLSQKVLGRAGRLVNLQGKIRIVAGREIASRVVLVDDVCTTGATLSACAAALRMAGCLEVRAVTALRD